MSKANTRLNLLLGGGCFDTKYSVDCLEDLLNESSIEPKTYDIIAHQEGVFMQSGQKALN